MGFTTKPALRMVEERESEPYHKDTKTLLEGQETKDWGPRTWG
jgi:hypothetical protein